MKAMVLAAGLGTRLRPLTDDKPKCLVPLAGRPLIDWTLRWLHSCGITECIINLHYWPEKVQSFVGDGKTFEIKVHYSYEQELLGTAGAVKKVAEYFDQPFYVIYSDNFTLWDLSKLKTLHKQKKAIATMAVHWREDVTQSGMMEMDSDDRILWFIEKPKPHQVTSHYVNAGFFIMDPRLLEYIPEGQFSDFGHHILPELIRSGEKLYAVKMEDPIIGIDTPEAYARADAYALEILKQRKNQGEAKRRTP